MNTAWLEPISSVIRVGSEGAKHLDNYHFAATVRYRSSEEVEIVGLVKRSNGPGITKADWVAIIACFREAGVKWILFKRIKLGTVRKRWVKV